MKTVDWTKERKERGEKLAKDFADLVNDMGHDKDSFILSFCNQHRTLQQSGLEMIFKLIDHCASEYNKGHYDLRNENSYKMCNQIRQLVRDRSDYYDKWWKQPLI